MSGVCGAQLGSAQGLLRGAGALGRPPGELSGLQKQSTFCFGSAESPGAGLRAKYPAGNFARPLQEPGKVAPSV